MGSTDRIMKPGQVVRIRVSPKDCMACVDICRAVGLNMNNMSFAQVVKIALASCAESMRQNNVIPHRTGFEYSDMMSPFQELNIGSRAAKLGVTRLVDGIGERFSPQPVATASPELERATVRLQELFIKKEADPLNFTPSEEEEMLRLISVASQD